MSAGAMCILLENTKPCILEQDMIYKKSIINSCWLNKQINYADKKQVQGSQEALWIVSSLVLKLHIINNHLESLIKRNLQDSPSGDKINKCEGWGWTTFDMSMKLLHSLKNSTIYHRSSGPMAKMKCKQNKLSYMV